MVLSSPFGRGIPEFAAAGAFPAQSLLRPVGAKRRRLRSFYAPAASFYVCLMFAKAALPIS